METQAIKRVTILGAGSWGITLARLLQSKGHQILLWGHDPERTAKLQRERRDEARLPGIPIAKEIQVDSTFNHITETEYILFAVPSHTVREIALKLAGISGKRKESLSLISTIKGIETGSGKRVSEILTEVLGKDHRIGVLSGPTIAREVAAGYPTSAVVASSDEAYAEELQVLLHTPRFRVYRSTDPVGVELGGALKNIVALAAGMVTALDLGVNAMGALLTRGLAEIRRLGVALGADPLTFSGLSGMGDLITTCFSPHSRNRYVGEELGRGKSLHTILEDMPMVAEGVRTTEAALVLAKNSGVEVPITKVVSRILKGEVSPGEALEHLLGRELKPEILQG